MARLVIIEFPNDKEADTFVRQCYSKGGVGFSIGTRPVAVIQRPTRGCNCDKQLPQSGGRRRSASRRRRISEWTRGKNYGWMVCATCGRPTWRVVQVFNWSIVGGYNNLLRQVLRKGEPESPDEMYERVMRQPLPIPNGRSLDETNEPRSTTDPRPKRRSRR